MMSKVNGRNYKGKKYNRSTDFKRDDTKTLIRKANAKIKEQKEIIEILEARKVRAKKAGKTQVVKSIDEFLISIV